MTSLKRQARDELDARVLAIVNEQGETHTTKVRDAMGARRVSVARVGSSLKRLAATDRLAVKHKPTPTKAGQGRLYYRLVSHA